MIMYQLVMCKPLVSGGLKLCIFAAIQVSIFSSRVVLGIKIWAWNWVGYCALVNCKSTLNFSLSLTLTQCCLTQCARIRVPVVSMKIERFKDLFRAALDRWWDSHESKNFGAGCTRQPIRPNFSTILPILGKI